MLGSHKHPVVGMRSEGLVLEVEDRKGYNERGKGNIRPNVGESQAREELGAGGAPALAVNPDGAEIGGSLKAERWDNDLDEKADDR